MDDKTRKMLYDNVENPWDFVVKASARYKEEFRKTSKIGRAPSIDAVLGDYIRELVEGVKPEDKPEVSEAPLDEVKDKPSAAVKDA